MKITQNLVILLSLMGAPKLSAACKYNLDTRNVDFTWTGFKTPKKLGVSGKITDIKLAPGKTASDAVAALEGMSFTINLNSVSSGDTVRDTRIGKILFKGSETITGKLLKSDKEYLYFEINHRKKGIQVPMKYSIVNNKIEASAFMDLLDFAMDNNLAEFAKACAGRHEGKTWSDFKTDLVLNVKKSC